MAVLSDYLVTDELTIVLALVAITVWLLHSIYKPLPLAHPILLGRQSDVARVRHPGESAVYRNYGTGVMGRFPLRPNKDVQLVSDLLKDVDIPRMLWSTSITNSQLKDRVAAFSTGLVSVAKLVPKESNVFILLNDCLEFLVADLALASLSITSITVSHVGILRSCLELHPRAAIITDTKMLPQVLETISESTNELRIIVTGEHSTGRATQGPHILRWTDIESAGSKMDKIELPSPSSSDVFTIAYSESESGRPQGVHLTHENVIAGVTAVRALFPLSGPLSSWDTVVSAFSLSTPFGRAVAYTALYESTNFATLSSTTTLFYATKAPKADVSDVLSSPVPFPTVQFIKPGHLGAMTSSILEHSSNDSFVYPLALRHKQAGIEEGFVTKESIWDRLVFDGARRKVMGEGFKSLRAVIVSGGPLESTLLASARIALSVPIVNAHTHPLVTAPVFASHAFDVQKFPEAEGFSTVAHVGPPGINVEAKLIGVNDEEIESGADPMGDLVVRGPPVGRVIGEDEEMRKSGWVSTGDKARVQRNGSFKVYNL